VRITLVGVAVAAMAVGTVPSLAEDQGVTRPTNNRDVMVCKMVPATTGTRLGARRTCRPQREWDERRQLDRQMTEETQMRDSRNPCLPSGACP
jgi:hypothetical protein